ncbi:hypothetical protein PENARI_c022G05283 [Neofusicoccum parvum]|uniref:Uncharacterized protein n=1 Tax=Neofusicoccum parvum TaxID=310453 RepID=A0ACB5RSZ6_9PEZI|nr:hypothetical protein PENARI_c022G05283 [Neofusicoccum parvum]
MSSSDNQALNIVFFNTGDSRDNPHPLAVQISGTFPNGTAFFGQAMADDGVVIEHGPDGISGDWKGSGAKFQGTSLDSPNTTYTITFDSPEIGVQGSFHLQSASQPRAPAHYPCALIGAANATQLLLPHLHWANAVPDATASVNLTINGTAVAFHDGIGYHDKNWGDASVITSPKYWDWGHARFGPYSVVWYDLLDYGDAETVRAYVARDGEAMAVGCGADALVVRQADANATYPPGFGLAVSQGLQARFDLGGGQVLVANVTKEYIVHDETVYACAVGAVLGGIEGQGEMFEGRAFYEEFVLGILGI